MTNSSYSSEHARASRLLAIGVAMGSVLGILSCTSTVPNPNHCSYQSGDEWCAARYEDGSRPFCSRGISGCEEESDAWDGCLSPKLPPGKKYCMPDFVVGTGTKPLSAEQITAIYELKTPCNREGEPLPSIESWHPDKAMGGTMRRCYERVHLKGEKPNPEKLKVEAIGPTKESCP